MLAVLVSVLIAAHSQGNDKPLSTGRAAEPVTSLPSLFAVSDYPPEALAQRKQGITDFRLRISATGRVEDCRVERSSGSAALDEATCRVITRRARFRPGINAAGRPVPSIYTGMIHWTL